MRKIDADRLTAELHNTEFRDGDDRAMVYQAIERQPTIEEPKPGRWIMTKDKRGYACAVCSSCGMKMYAGKTKFCPECGSDNREVNRHDR